ncbi:MAG: bifunctional phosphoribosyl-AMP cyclohydrolase/phosphoribosyl-ATP diphosphatase HisIE [Eubacterium sp.]|nr:bifunctional phosphoribosyl-AMP cyclohydrolase/phosphoribosyl-ATP diphosphatase HisIE [Eubacterium sp.]
MKFKNLISCVYLKNGKAFVALDNKEPSGPRDITYITNYINDSGIDQLVVFNLANNESEHQIHLGMLKSICEHSEVPVSCGGYISSAEQAKKILHAGAMQVIFNGSKPNVGDAIKEAAERFGKERIVISLADVDILFKKKDIIESCVSYIIVCNEKQISAIENIVSIPMIPVMLDVDFDKAYDYLQKDNIIGIGGAMISSFKTEIMDFKAELVKKRIEMNTFVPSFEWSELKKNSDGLIPAIVQDYVTGEVLMLAYMNEESYYNTMKTGKMTYWSRSRNELWLKGDTSGHYQYVKALYTDCDYDTILAKVSQIGAACHTGARSCFFNEILKKNYMDRNPLMVLTDVMEMIKNRKENPVEGSYTNQILAEGTDANINELNKEFMHVVLAAKNNDKTNLRHEISDFLYQLMILMEENDINWLDVAREIANRE